MKKLKLLGLCGSPRKGATLAVMRAALEQAAEKEGVETSLSLMAGKKVAPCNGCGFCRQNNAPCVIKDDYHALYQEFLSADAYLVGSPVYVHGVTPQLAAFFSRMRQLHHYPVAPFRMRVGAAFSVGGTRNGGQEATVDTIIHLMMTKGINMVSNEPGGYIGGKVWSQDKPGFAPDDDEVGMKTVYSLVDKLADVALAVNRGLG